MKIKQKFQRYADFLFSAVTGVNEISLGNVPGGQHSLGLGIATVKKLNGELEEIKENNPHLFTAQNDKTLTTLEQIIMTSPSSKPTVFDLKKLHNTIEDVISERDELLTKVADYTNSNGGIAYRAF